MKKKLIQIIFEDDIHGNSDFLIKTAKCINEIDELIYSIRDKLEKEGFEDWSYYDIIEKLGKEQNVKIVQRDCIHQVRL